MQAGEKEMQKRIMDLVGSGKRHSSTPSVHQDPSSNGLDLQHRCPRPPLPPPSSAPSPSVQTKIPSSPMFHRNEFSDVSPTVRKRQLAKSVSGEERQVWTMDFGRVKREDYEIGARRWSDVSACLCRVWAVWRPWVKFFRKQTTCDRLRDVLSCPTFENGPS